MKMPEFPTEPMFPLRCVSCGRFLGFNTALAVQQWDPTILRHTVAAGPYDARCAEKVPPVKEIPWWKSKPIVSASKPPHSENTP